MEHELFCAFCAVAINAWGADGEYEGGGQRHSTDVDWAAEYLDRRTLTSKGERVPLTAMTIVAGTLMCIVHARAYVEGRMKFQP